MPALTLFVDESGIFEPNVKPAPVAPWAPGLRVVVGVALPGTPADARAAAELLVEAAVRKVMPWWPGALHGRELRHPPDLAKRVLEASDPPGELVELARAVARLGDDPGLPRPPAWERARSVGHRLLNGVRHEIGRSLDRDGVRVVLVSEHGAFGGALPYARMVRALVGQGAASLGFATSEPIEVAAIVAAREGRPSPELEPSEWRRRIEAISEARQRAGGAAVTMTEPVVTVADARLERGLQIADLFAHALGPKSKQTVRPSPGEIAARTLARIRRDVSAAFGVTPALLCEFDARDMQARVAACIDVLGGVESYRRAAAELDAVARRAALPNGTYPSAREQLAATGRALTQLNAAYRTSMEQSR